MIDTVGWRNIGERLWAIREHVASEEMFLANYSDGLANVNCGDDRDLPAEREDRLLSCRAPPSVCISSKQPERQGRQDSREPGCQPLGQRGLLCVRPEIFDYMREGEELVEAPFQRLIETDQLLGFKHEDFWRPWIR